MRIYAYVYICLPIYAPHWRVVRIFRRGVFFSSSPVHYFNICPNASGDFSKAQLYTQKIPIF